MNINKRKAEAQRRIERSSEENRNKSIEYNAHLLENMPRGKKGTIKIRVSVNGTPQLQDADATIYGDWAINPTKFHNGKKAYPVTHIPSGLRVETFDSPEQAKRLVSAIHDADIKLPKEVKDAPKDVIDRMKSILSYVLDNDVVPEYYKNKHC